MKTASEILEQTMPNSLSVKWSETICKDISYMLDNGYLGHDDGQGQVHFDINAKIVGRFIDMNTPYDYTLVKDIQYRVNKYLEHYGFSDGRVSVNLGCTDAEKHFGDERYTNDFSISFVAKY